jgi:hypothetical protein
VKSARLTSAISRPTVVAPPQFTGGFWAARTITKPAIRTTTASPTAVAPASEGSGSRRRSAIRPNAIAGRTSTSSGHEDPSPTATATASASSLRVVGRARQASRRCSETRNTRPENWSCLANPE